MLLCWVLFFLVQCGISWVEFLDVKEINSYISLIRKGWNQKIREPLGPFKAQVLIYQVRPLQNLMSNFNLQFHWIFYRLQTNFFYQDWWLKLWICKFCFNRMLRRNDRLEVCFFSKPFIKHLRAQPAFYQPIF